jgi:general secretion pathway protein A
MYESFFALTKAPFSLVPDPDCIHLTAQHADAISGLAFGILERKGYLALTAEAGLGKTTALRALSQLLAESNAEASVIFAPTLTASEFLELTMLNFGFREVPSSKAVRFKMLEQFLLRADEENRVMALIVDEAHQLSAELLEEVRLMGNFETTHRKLLQIVLVGQNQLNEKLNLPELAQLKQRIAVRLSLQRLDRQAVEEYIRFRWGKAGGQEPTPFSDAALHAISTWSGGNPRLINVICENALLIAFSDTNRTVDVKTVRDACEELSVATPTIARSSPAFAGARPLIANGDSSLVKRDLEPGEFTESEDVQDSWAMWRPSLLKRLMRRSDAQERARTRSRTGILSLNKP